MADPAPRSCIFCGGRPVTREHVWPQWLTGSFPDLGLHDPQPSGTREIPRVRMASIRVDEDGDERAEFGGFYDDSKGFGGSLASQVIKAACGPCNNGWMATLEGAAKPIILRQITEWDHRLTEAERAILVRWLIKTTAVFEMDDPESAVLTAEERAQIADPAFPLGENWLIETVTSRRGVFQMGHGRVAALDVTTGEFLQRSLLQTIQIGPVLYLLQFRANDSFAFRRFGGMKREQLHPAYDAGGSRVELGRLWSWRVSRGSWFHKHLYKMDYQGGARPNPIGS